jgi:uncharacterized membrane protein
MATENTELMADAREALSDKWGLAIGTLVVYWIIVGGINAIPGIGSLASLILSGPFAIGLAIFSLNLSRRKEAKLEQIFDGFQNFGNAVGAYILMVLIVFLWMLLLIVPGIIAAISYSQVFFIIAEDKDIGPMDALKKSRDMMDGYKMKYFEMSLRFLGWGILCLFTLGIGFLWLGPYAQVSYANFHDDINDNYYKENKIKESDVLDGDLV